MARRFGSGVPARLWISQGVARFAVGFDAGARRLVKESARP
jgi:hypothetical protein